MYFFLCWIFKPSSPSFILLISIFVSFLATAEAGPACALRHRKTTSLCIAECQGNWGWPGVVMSTDRWGTVLIPKQADKQVVIEEACGAPVAQVVGNQSTEPHKTTTKTTVPVAATSITPISLPAITVDSAPSPSAAAPPDSVSPLADTTPASNPDSTSADGEDLYPLDSHQATTIAQGTANTRATSTRTTSTRTTSTSTNSPSNSKNHAPSPFVSKVAVASVASQGSDTGSTGGGTVSGDASAYLAAHNGFRAQHGATALTWNTTLANKAQQWANRCVFKHSGGSLGPFGENLAAGTGDYSIATAVQDWENEASKYNPKDPQPSHFTQVVWKATTELGCAMAVCNGIFASSFGPAQFYVCEYFVAGNVIGEFSDNVQA